MLPMDDTMDIAPGPPPVHGAMVEPLSPTLIQRVGVSEELGDLAASILELHTSELHREFRASFENSALLAHRLSPRMAGMRHTYYLHRNTRRRNQFRPRISRTVHR